VLFLPEEALRFFPPRTGTLLSLPQWGQTDIPSVSSVPQYAQRCTPSPISTPPSAVPGGRISINRGKNAHDPDSRIIIIGQSNYGKHRKTPGSGINCRVFFKGCYKMLRGVIY
jgi:hypothetical protein